MTWITPNLRTPDLSYPKLFGGFWDVFFGGRGAVVSMTADPTKYFCTYQSRPYYVSKIILSSFKNDWYHLDIRKVQLWEDTGIHRFDIECPIYCVQWIWTYYTELIFFSLVIFAVALNSSKTFHYTATLNLFVLFPKK